MSHSRHPAVPALADRMALNGMIFLDDAGREPEREIVTRWSEEQPGWKFGIDAASGIAVGSRA
jgi:hypothetical protein